MLLPDPIMRTEDYIVLDLADMLRRDGNRLYGASNYAYQSALCGLTASYHQNGDIVALKAHDLNLSITLSVMPVDDNDGIERYKTEKTNVTVVYHTGDTQALNAWHRHLCAYRRSMRSIHSAVA